MYKIVDGIVKALGSAFIALLLLAVMQAAEADGGTRTYLTPANDMLALCYAPQPAPHTPDVLKANMVMILDGILPSHYAMDIAYTLRMMNSDHLRGHECIWYELVKRAPLKKPINNRHFIPAD